MSNATTTVQEFEAMKARIAVLNREVGMLRQGRPNVKGICAGRSIMRAIASREEELSTLIYHMAVIDRVGLVEITRVDMAASCS